MGAAERSRTPATNVVPDGRPDVLIKRPGSVSPQTTVEWFAWCNVRTTHST
jgi:hypothetical protein